MLFESTLKNVHDFILEIASPDSAKLLISTMKFSVNNIMNGTKSRSRIRFKWTLYVDWCDKQQEIKIKHDFQKYSHICISFSKQSKTKSYLQHMKLALTHNISLNSSEIYFYMENKELWCLSIFCYPYEFDTASCLNLFSVPITSAFMKY